jgi:hypothetical protein
MGTTRMDADKMRRALGKAVNPFGTTSFVVGRVQAIVMVNGEEQHFDIDGLVIEAVHRDQASARSTDMSGATVSQVGRTPPAGRGKLRMIAVDGVTLQ